MKIKLIFTALALAWLSLMSCGGSDSEPATPTPTSVMVEEAWDFNTANGWNYYHQDTATVTQWALTDGCLELTTRRGTDDRTKMATNGHLYTDGLYSWRTYVPAIGEAEQVSVGSWIYHDDHHELDFEVGSGKAAIREQYNVAPDELLACMTNQDYPFVSGYTPIKPGWHDFAIRLDVRPDGNYTALWIIDGQEKQRINLGFGPEIGFNIHCSVENLKFIGDVPTRQDYTGRYDRVEFKGHKIIKN